MPKPSAPKIIPNHFPIFFRSAMSASEESFGKYFAIRNNLMAPTTNKILKTGKINKKNQKLLPYRPPKAMPAHINVKKAIIIRPVPIPCTAAPGNILRSVSNSYSLTYTFSAQFGLILKKILQWSS